MPNFFVLRGAPGSGKSTWIYDNELENYVISSDETRLELVGTEIDESGNEVISQANTNQVWSTINSRIEYGMSQGWDIILDSTALKTADIQRYENWVAQYGYDAYIVDFTDVPEDVCKERNAMRETMRIVPEFVIERFYDLLPNQPVPGFYTIITPDEAAMMF